MNPAIDMPQTEEESIPSSAPLPTPNDPPWNSWVAIGVWVISVVLVGVVPIIFVAPYLLQRGINYNDQAGLREFMQKDPTAIMLQLAPVILVHGLTLAIAWFVVTKFKTYSFRQTLGWRMNGFRVWHAVLITIVFYGIVVSLTSLFGEVENEFELMLKSSRYAVYLVAFFATFTAPLVEEVVYRGLLYSAFQRRFGIVLAVIFVTLLFTAVHVPQYSLGTTPDYAAVISLLLLSLTLTGIRAWTNNLLPCIVLHTIFNGASSVLLLAEPYVRSLEPVVEPTTSLILK